MEWLSANLRGASNPRRGEVAQFLQYTTIMQRLTRLGQWPENKTMHSLLPAEQLVWLAVWPALRDNFGRQSTLWCDPLSLDSVRVLLVGEEVVRHLFPPRLKLVVCHLRTCQQMVDPQEISPKRLLIPILEISRIPASVQRSIVNSLAPRLSAHKPGKSHAVGPQKPFRRTTCRHLGTTCARHLLLLC